MNENLINNSCVEKYNFSPFSVAISVYKNDNPEWVNVALESIIIKQTVKPSEVVLVIDGPISEELQSIIEKYDVLCKDTKTIDMKIIRFSENKGLGIALKVAIENCSNELIARMDSDDISVNDRFEKQLQFFEEHSDVDIVGGNIEEFYDNPNNPIAIRVVPTTDKDIKEYMKVRCPFNHVAVMYKKSAVIASGNYEEWFWNEDYYLWVRMELANCKFANINKVLVYVRTGIDMYKRRGGKKYYESERELQKYMYKSGLINFKTYKINCMKRWIVQVLMPNWCREWVYKRFARKKVG